MVKSRHLCAIAAIVVLAVPCCHAQTWGSTPTLDQLEQRYVKSLNEFMHRFNADEVPPYLQGDSATLRQKCILALFDLAQAPDLGSPKAQQMLRFDSIVCADNILLHIADSGLLTEAHCQFIYKKRTVELNLILRYELIRDGYYRWVLVGANGLAEAHLIDTSRYGYINPVNHELHLSELSHAFPTMNGHFSIQHKIDALSYLAGLAESGALQFDGCSDVVYWFTQVPGWVFSVSSHPRFDANSGWLIHDLQEMDDNTKTSFINKLKGQL